jgi:N-acyl amino acid synthase of PEP-CTERM/exosortase system
MCSPDSVDLGAGFSKYFTVVPAVTEEIKRAAYRIRHDVYCRELGYEALRADEMETDAYDAHSVHCVLKSRNAADYIGCVRLVLARPGDSHYPLPFEKACAAAIDRAVVDPAKLPREKIAEVSRLAVISRYRRRQGEANQPGGITENDFGTSERPRFPYIPAGLYLGMIAQARRLGIETLFTLTEPKLAKHLSRLGVQLQRIGEPVEYRGLRIPSLISVDGVISGLNDLVRVLFDVIATEIDAVYREVVRAQNSPDNLVRPR